MPSASSRPPTPRPAPGPIEPTTGPSRTTSTDSPVTSRTPLNPCTGCLLLHALRRHELSGEREGKMAVSTAARLPGIVYPEDPPPRPQTLLLGFPHVIPTFAPPALVPPIFGFG